MEYQKIELSCTHVSRSGNVVRLGLRKNACRIIGDWRRAQEFSLKGHHVVAIGPQVGEHEVGPGKRPQAWAWGLCWLMFACTVLNYMDRQAIALVGPQVKAQFGLDNLGFGWVLAAFQLSYAFFQWPAGYLADRWDVRRTYAGAVLGWSLAGIATAFAPTLGVLMVFRGLLGAGESFNWPCALRVTAGVLPPADRSLGNGIFNSGAAIGAVLTPLCVAPLAAWLGWRSPFLVLGLGGLVWVAVWLPLSRGPGLSDATPPQQAGSNAGLSRSARRAFLAVLALAAATALSGFYFGLPALWFGIAVLMIGILIAALCARPQPARRCRLGQQPGRDRAPAQVLGDRGGGNHHQRHLAFPRQLDRRSSSRKSAGWACWWAAWSARCRSWRPTSVTLAAEH